ncbi:MAG: hypothetical protein GX456_01915 [Verrucomicrobia bacterium]|nr:hypothetical protein [Verrucomicrobiota bacterium]
MWIVRLALRRPYTFVVAALVLLLLTPFVLLRMPTDIVSQTINFGLPAPFDIQIVGRDQAQNRAVARLRGQRFAAAVALVKSLGGGFSSRTLTPTAWKGQKP